MPSILSPSVLLPLFSYPFRAVINIEPYVDFAGYANAISGLDPNSYEDLGALAEVVLDSVDLEEMAMDVVQEYGYQDGSQAFYDAVNRICEGVTAVHSDTFSEDHVDEDFIDRERYRGAVTEYVGYMRACLEQWLLREFHPTVAELVGDEMHWTDRAATRLTMILSILGSGNAATPEEAATQVLMAQLNHEGMLYLPHLELGNINREQSSQTNMRLSTTGRELLDVIGRWYGLRMTPLVEYLLRNEARRLGIVTSPARATAAE
jgi:hypothetical protein